jgi:hypothetical protein
MCLHRRGVQVAASTRADAHAICNLHDAEQVMFGRGFSPGPKPGRNGFSVKLAGVL